MRLSQRAQRIEPFYVMEVAKAARTLACQVQDSAQPMIFLNIGEPDFTAVQAVQDAATQAIRAGLSHYTPAIGLPELRERISEWYHTRHHITSRFQQVALWSLPVRRQLCIWLAWP